MVRRSFTHTEVNVIRALLRRKVRAPRDEQKRIRDELRGRGFYISDFRRGGRVGFTEGDLDDLIARGAVVIVD